MRPAHAIPTHPSTHARLRRRAGAEFRCGSKKASETIHSLFLDPTGHHAVISMAPSGENFCWHTSQSQARAMKKVSGVVLESVAWNPASGTAHSTERILFGTQSGTVLESVLEDGKDRVCRVVHRVDTGAPVCGLLLRPSASGAASTAAGGGQWVALLATADPCRLYSFRGGPDMQSLFRVEAAPSFTQFPFAADCRAPLAAADRSFALLTGVGVYHGSLRVDSPEQADKVVEGTRMLALNEPATAVATSALHVLLLHRGRALVRNKLNDSVALELPVDPAACGDAVVADRDPCTGDLWVAAQSRLLRIQPVDESRDAWWQYLARARAGDARSFGEALRHCRTPSQRESVLTALADHHFKAGEYTEAARAYARTSRSFEEIALRFVRTGMHVALITFLRARLESLGARDKMQRTALATWLVELYLAALHDLRRRGDTEGESSTLSAFHEFLSSYHGDLDRETTFHLLASHGRSEEALFFAEVTRDYERVVAHHMRSGDVAAATRVLRDAPAARARPLVYKFAAQMLRRAPARAIELWKSMPQLDPRSLVPALVRYTQRGTEAATGTTTASSSSSSNNAGGDGEATGEAASAAAAAARARHALGYLTFCAQERGLRDAALHNFMLALLARLRDEDELLNYLQQHQSDPPFDTEYALRVCAQHDCARASVQVYGMMGLHEEAVALALGQSRDLATYHAGRCKDPSTRRRLWLQIVRRAMEGGGKDSVRRGMDLLRRSESLTVADALPFVPDNSVIDDFRSAITDALQRFQDRTAELREDMDAHTATADRIRADIRALRDRYGFVSAGQRCDLTERHVLSGPFYIFPCTHCFLAEALVEAACGYLPASQRERVQALWKRACALEDEASEGSAGAAAAAAAAAQMTAFGRVGGARRSRWHAGSGGDKREEVQEELDELIARECPLCGEPMIDSIKRPFITPQEAEDQAADWEL